MLTECPRCRYSLQGLPARHACPECGLRYDERSQAWRKDRPRGAIVGAAAIGLAIVAHTFAILLSRAFSGQPLTRLAVIGTYALPMGFLGLLILRAYWRGLVAAVTRDGLFVVGSLGISRMIPWDRISGAQRYPYRIPSAVRVFLKGRRLYLKVRNVFRTAADADALVSAIAERLATPGVGAKIKRLEANEE